LKQRTNDEWIEALSDPISDEALSDLRTLLLRGLRASLSSRITTDLDAITEDFAQEALLKILNNLHSFRGESRFTTWAQKIAIHVAFTELRRRRWKDVSLQEIVETPEGEEYTPIILKDSDASPELEATQDDIMAVVGDLIENELTERQRTAMLAILQSGMAMDEIARQLGTNRNALYKLLHDARKRLQQRLEETAGLTALDIMELFEQ
jgi:RNA polymerase sigma-70 factor (ECF subfamily)